MNNFTKFLTLFFTCSTLMLSGMENSQQKSHDTRAVQLDRNIEVLPNEICLPILIQSIKLFCDNNFSFDVQKYRKPKEALEGLINVLFNSITHFRYYINEIGLLNHRFNEQINYLKPLINAYFRSTMIQKLKLVDIKIRQEASSKLLLLNKKNISMHRNILESSCLLAMAPMKTPLTFENVNKVCDILKLAFDYGYITSRNDILTFKLKKIITYGDMPLFRLLLNENAINFKLMEEYEKKEKALRKGKVVRAYGCRCVKKEKNNFLEIIVKNNRKEILVELLKTINDQKKLHAVTHIVLFLAIAHKNKQIVELMIGYGVNLSLSKWNSSIRSFGYDNLLISLLEDRAITMAAAIGATDIVEFLILHGIDINMASENGATPLFCAAQRGQAEVVKLLIDRGCNINAQNRFGDTPLMMAAAINRKDIVELLVKAHADVNILSNQKKQR